MRLLIFSVLLFISSFVTLVFIDYLNDKALNLLDNTLQAFILGLVFAFGNWAFGKPRSPK
ncbi:hypothetical protein JI666_13640 [Bacillus sp. NTK071]|uniref:hypothetical protein n=1 Tax=Bacillus sp. NTK071 TaxID=2802175 RepID=UPI001A8D4CE9|nr:hypothetical protein [Bacillus sp. NTK071]MBN8209794.1 hypothetical protein [Bacillus sp. NTK071]